MTDSDRQWLEQHMGPGKPPLTEPEQVEFRAIAGRNRTIMRQIHADNIRRQQERDRKIEQAARRAWAERMATNP
jgi:hypothetical protein